MGDDGMDGKEALTEDFSDKGSDGRESEVDEEGVGGNGEFVLSVLFVRFGLYGRESFGDELNVGVIDCALVL